MPLDFWKWTFISTGIEHAPTNGLPAAVQWAFIGFIEKALRHTHTHLIEQAFGQVI